MPTPQSSRLPLILGAVSVLAVAGWAAWHFILAPKGAGAQGGGMAAMMAMGGLPVEAAPVEEKPMSTTLETIGQLQSEHGVVLKSEITAKVLAIPVKDGTPVKTGTLLIQLDDATQKAALAQAEANLAVSEANVGRYQRLLTLGAASQLQVDNAVAEAKLARANVQSARATLAKTRITAPFAGTAGIAQVTAGEMVQPGSTLVAVNDNANLKILLNLPETAANITPGTAVTVKVDGSETEIPATLAAIENRVDPATRTVGAKVTLNGEETGVKAGQFVRVVVPTATNPKALVVPDNALVPEGAETYIYVINATPKGTMASRTTVTVGMRAKNEAEITSPIQPGTLVVTAGQQKLQAPVMPVKASSPTVITRSQPVVENLDVSKED